MAHRSSAAAVAAAYKILDACEVSVRAPEQLAAGTSPIRGLQATKEHLSIIIDRSTNAFEVVKHRPELWYWQARLASRDATAGQIAAYLKTLIQSFSSVPLDNPKEPNIVEAMTNLPWGGYWSRIRLQKYSREAANAICAYYEVRVKARPVPADLVRVEVGKIIEVTLGLRKALAALPLLRTCLQKLIAGQITNTEVGAVFEKLTGLMECFPNYEERQEESKLLV